MRGELRGIHACFVSSVLDQVEHLPGAIELTLIPRGTRAPAMSLVNCFSKGQSATTL